MLKPYLLYIAYKKSPQKIAIQAFDKQITYKQLYYIVCSVSQLLEESPNIQKSYYVGVAPQQNLEYIILLYAMQLLQKITVLLDPKAPVSIYECYLDCIIGDKVLHNQISHIPFQKIKFLIYTLLNNNNKNIPSKYKTNKYRYLLGAKKNNIIFTSGTTKDPKAIVHSYKNHYYSAISSNKYLNFTSKDSWLLNLPLFHVSGYSILYRVALAQATIILDKSPTNSISSFVSMVPTQILKILDTKKGNAHLKTKKCILLGGSSIPKNLILKITQNKLPVYCTYGCSEMSSQIATSNPQLLLSHLQVKAKVLPLHLIKISTNNEIMVKSPALFDCYLTASKSYIAKKLDLDGYWNTQDLGSINNDLLSINGRIDNMFISGGENIYPEEIEYHLEEYSNIIRGCVIYQESKLYGKRPVAYIEQSNILSIKEIEKIKVFLSKRLPEFKIPVFFYCLPSHLKEGIKISRKKVFSYHRKYNTQNIV